jgi:hypothetical protein
MRTEHEKTVWKAKMANLAKKIKGMNETEKQQFVGNNLIITAEGHRLSLRNTCLLMFQCSDYTPTQIGGFRQWQKIGRIVQKGQHACGCIMVPMSSKKQDIIDDKKDSIHFRWVPVFDVSQTEVIGETAAA